MVLVACDRRDRLVEVRFIIRHAALADLGRRLSRRGGGRQRRTSPGRPVGVAILGVLFAWAVRRHVVAGRAPGFVCRRRFASLSLAPARALRRRVIRHRASRRRGSICIIYHRGNRRPPSRADDHVETAAGRRPPQLRCHLFAAMIAVDAAAGVHVVRWQSDGTGPVSDFVFLRFRSSLCDYEPFDYRLALCAAFPGGRHRQRGTPPRLKRARSTDRGGANDAPIRRPVGALRMKTS